jgi:hypothetical protein
MWLPAALLVTAAVMAATGVRMVGPSFGASTGTSTVSATVTPELHIGGTCPGFVGGGPTMAPGDATTSLGACTLTFGTNNNATGALIRVESERPGAGNHTFCSTVVTAACGATSFADVAMGGAASLADGEFGVRVTAAPTCVAPTWTNSNYYGVPDATTAGAGSILCDQSNTTVDASYALQFAANPGAGTTAGLYRGSAVFTVEAS